MEGRFSLGIAGGLMTVAEEQGRAVIRVSCPDDGKGLYKAYLVGRGGKLNLGTLVPEGNALRLTRTLLISELERRDMWPVTGGGVELSFPFEQKTERGQRPIPAGWRREEHLGQRMGDRLLSRCAASLCGVLIRSGEEGFWAAMPYREDREFPMTPLFCFAQLEQLNGQPYVVYRFSLRGCPMFPLDGR